MTAIASMRPDLDLVHVQYKDAVSKDQIVAMVEEVIQDPDHYLGVTEVCDLSEITAIDISFPQMIQLRDYLAKLYPRAPKLTHSHLLAPCDLCFGMVRMYQMVSDDVIPNLAVHIHRTEADLLAALGRDETRLADVLGA